MCTPYMLLKIERKIFYCCLFGLLNSILWAEKHKAHLLALNCGTFFARNVSVFHLASQRKAEFLEKFVKINNILLSTQCKQDIRVHFLCLPPKYRIHYFIQKKKKNVETYLWEDWWRYEQWCNIKELLSGKWISLISGQYLL